MLFRENPSYAYIFDLIGGVETGSDDDIPTYLKYYADEKARVKWGHYWPGDKIPKHEDPPFDRDRFLHSRRSVSIEQNEMKPSR